MHASKLPKVTLAPGASPTTRANVMRAVRDAVRASAAATRRRAVTTPTDRLRPGPTVASGPTPSLGARDGGVQTVASRPVMPEGASGIPATPRVANRRLARTFDTGVTGVLRKGPGVLTPAEPKK
jgi:hypothetical protein